MRRVAIATRILPHTTGLARSAVAAAAFAAALAHGTTPSAAQEPTIEQSTPASAGQQATAKDDTGVADLARFLDRLMLAESGGQDDARNPRSTAVGPFQFIESTFLDVAQRYFEAETRDLDAAAVLKLRTNRAFARKVAEAFTRDNARALVAAGLVPTFGNLRLAYLAGSDGAIRVLKAEPRTPVVAILGRRAARANPFLAGMSAADLARWSARNIAIGGYAVVDGGANSAAAARPAAASKPALVVRCNQLLVSCRRWVTLATERLERPRKIATRKR